MVNISKTILTVFALGCIIFYIYKLKGDAMEKEDKYVVVKLPFDENGQVILGEKKEEVVCEVCGQKNEKGTLICKMCSNYINK